MKEVRCILSFLLFICLYNTAISQNSKIQIGAELRPRMLIDNGYKTPKSIDENTLSYITQRTRLNILFANNKIESYVSLQDIRIWGADNNYTSTGVYSNTESLSINQAWTKLKLNNYYFIKIGRQLFAYDDQRIISSRNWNDYQVTYDALLFEYKIEKHLFNLGLTYNTESKNNVFYSEQKFKTFDFLYYKYQLNKLSFSSIAIITGNTLSDTTKQVLYRGTYGTNIIYNYKLLNIHSSIYYQQNLNKSKEKTSAWCFSVLGEYNFLKNLNIGLGLDYLSGNDETSTELTNQQFDLLYGRRHGWYGYMDYFSNIPKQGLQDYMVKIQYNPSPNISLHIDWHYFLLSANKYDVSNSNKLLSKKLGQEVDLKLDWKFNKETTFECGYSFYGLTETLKQVKNTNFENFKFPQYCYIMITLKPSAWVNFRKSEM